MLALLFLIGFNPTPFQKAIYDTYAPPLVKSTVIVLDVGVAALGDH